VAPVRDGAPAYEIVVNNLEKKDVIQLL